MCHVGPHTDRSSWMLHITGWHTSLLKRSYPPCHCDIPSHFALGKWLFWCKRAAQLGLLPSRTTLVAWLISCPSCATTSYHRAICCSAYTLCLQTFHTTHIRLWSVHIYPRNKIVAITYVPTPVEPQWESDEALHNVSSMPVDRDTSHLSVLSA